MILVIDDEQRKDYLIQIIRGYAYNNHGKEQQLMDVVNTMIKNNATVKDYVLALSDGLRYGNWPWTTNSTPKSFRGDE